MKNYKICIVGNSVALRNRPVSQSSKNYAQLLEELLQQKNPDVHHTVTNCAFSRATVIDVHRILHERIVNQFPDVYVINLGVCDGSTRPIPYWFAEIINGKKETLVKRLFEFVNDKIFKKYTTFFVRIRGNRPWINKRTFKKYFERILKEIRRNSNAQIVVLPINVGGTRLNTILPGSDLHFKSYNEIMKGCCADYDGHFVPLDDLDDKVHFPDGVHFSDKGHETVARRILDKIT